MPKATKQNAETRRRELEAMLAQVKSLQAQIPKLAQEQKLKVDRAELIERILKLRGLEEVRAAVDCIERDRGSVTPTERFVIEVLMEYAHGWLTPEAATKDLEEFRQEFNDMTEEASAFVKANPGQFKDVCAEVLKAVPDAPHIA